MTARTETSVAVFRGDTPYVNRVSMYRAGAWVSAGWRDVRETPQVSLFYGALFSAVGLGITALLWTLGLFALILPLAAGFMLVAPILAVGLYEVSRRLELGEAITLKTPLLAWRRNTGQVALLGFLLMFVLLVWIRIATLLFALFFSKSPPGLENFVAEIVLSLENIPFLLVGSGIGAVLATLVFSISVVSAPMLLDRNVSVFTAIVTSVTAVRENLQVMVAWAATIIAFTAAGLLTAYLGLIIAMPVIAHATWHAYRDLVVAEEKPKREKGAARGGARAGGPAKSGAAKGAKSRSAAAKKKS